MARYDAGDYRGALARFQQGYAMEHEPAFLYNIGRCHEQLGEVHPAIDAYERYLTESPQGEDAGDVQTRITRLQGEVRRAEGSTGSSPPPAHAELAEPGRPTEAGRRGRFMLGPGLSVLSPRQNPLILRFEAELRYEVTPGWRLVGDLSYIQVGEAGDTLSEEGLGLLVGALREWPLGAPESASFFPHARLGLALERTSTRHESSSFFVGARGGPGIDWRIVPRGSLSLDLEVGTGLLFINGDALYELTVGGTLRILFDFG
jgi:hypothetical protein